MRLRPRCLECMVVAQVSNLQSIVLLFSIEGAYGMMHALILRRLEPSAFP